MEIQHSSVAPPVLFCSICDKPFSKEAQLKRHLAYCRKNPSRTRPRSCRACNKSKIKCDFRSRCNQCVRRGIVCVYDHRKAAPAQQKRPGDSSNNNGTTTGLLGENTIGLAGDVSNFFPSSEDLELLPSAIPDDLFGLNDHIDMLAGVDLLPEISLPEETWDFAPKKPQFYIPSEACPTSDSLGFNKKWPVGRLNLSQQVQDMLRESDLRLDVSLSYDLSPFTPITEIAPYSFNVNRMSSVSKAYAKMIIDMIRPYPQMMMRRETFPPFIHPHLTTNGEDGLPFPLKNCMSIAQMFFGQNADTRSFVWSTIRNEMNDLVMNLQTFSKREALAALSASLMYLIMRATDSEPHDSVNDVEMVFIHQVICKRAIELAEDAFIKAEPMDSDNNWSDWVFRESCRRIIWVWFAISLVFCIQSNLPCLFAVTLQDKPLPSSKTEWEAQNESQWRTEHMLAEVRRSQLSQFIDLFDAHRTNDAAKLNIWNAGVDNLGMLLNFSANMLRER